MRCITPTKSLYIALLAALLVLLESCVNRPPEQPIAFLAFGDSGYHTDYIKAYKRSRVATLETYQAGYRQRWLDKGNPVEAFSAPPPYHIAPYIEQGVEYPGGWVMASGAEPVAKAMTRYCQSQHCEFAIMLGDNIYPSGADGTEADTARFRAVFEQPYQKLGASDPSFKIWAAFGNHDWREGWRGRQAQLDYAIQQNTQLAMKAPGYYRFGKVSASDKTNSAEFFVIDSTMLLEGAERRARAAAFEGDPDLKQLQWLQAALIDSTAHWKIVYGHHPLWSSGGGKARESALMRSLLLPLLCRHADIYLAGHEHDLEVHSDSCLRELGTVNPLPLVVSGAASKQRSISRPFQLEQRQSNTQYQEIWFRDMVWGFAHLSLFPQQLHLSMLTTPNDGSGVVVEERRIRFDKRLWKR